MDSDEEYVESSVADVPQHYKDELEAAKKTVTDFTAKFKLAATTVYGTSSMVSFATSNIISTEGEMSLLISLAGLGAYRDLASVVVPDLEPPAPPEPPERDRDEDEDDFPASEPTGEAEGAEPETSEASEEPEEAAAETAEE